MRLSGLVAFLIAFGLAVGASAQESPNPLIGSQLYRGYCLVCHGKAGKGDGPLAKKMRIQPADLSSDKYQKQTTELLAEIIGRYRKSSESNMPNWGLVLPQADVKHVAAYIGTLTRNDLRFRGNTTRGRLIYKNACFACHGENGMGKGLLAQLIKIDMIDFSRANSLQALDDEKLVKTITEGMGEFMPSWRGTLDDDEIVDVAAYIRMMSE